MNDLTSGNSWDIVDPLQCQIRDAVMDFMAETRRDGKIPAGFNSIAPISPDNLEILAGVVLFFREARPSKVTLFPNLFIENGAPRVKCFHKVKLRGLGRQRTIIAEFELLIALLQVNGFEERAATSYSKALSPLFKAELLKLDKAIHKKVEAFRNGPEYLKEVTRRKRAHFRAFHDKERASLLETFKVLTWSRWTEEEILEVWREQECAIVMKS